MISDMGSADRIPLSLNIESNRCSIIANEEQFRILIEGSLAGVYIIHENRFLYVNQAFAKIFGYEQDEIISGKTIKDLIAPESYGVVEAHVRNRLNGTENSSHYTFKGLRIDNSRVDIEVLGSVAVLNGRKCAIGTVLDITEHMRTEEEIRKFSLAVMQSPISIVITDAAGNIEYVNPKFTQITGYSFEEVEGKNPRILKSGAKSSDEYKELWETITSGAEWKGEFLNKKKNGELFWEQASISSIKDNAGKITHFLALKEDITDRKNAESKIREILQQQHALLDNIPDIAWLKDTKSRYIAVNKPFGNLCGKKPDQLVGKTDFDIFPTELAEKYVADDKEVMLSGKRKVVEEPIADKDGIRTWIETIKTPICNDKGIVIGTIGIARDVAGRRLAEESLKEVNSKLRNAYADLQSAQSQILQQEKMASIGQLAAGIAHEINNPIGFIISNLGSLQKYINRVEAFMRMQAEAIEQLAADKPDANGVLEAINEHKRSLKLDYILEDSESLIKESLDGADRVKHIVQNLKNFSRIDETEIKESDINEGLESTINIVWNELKYKVTLHKDYGDIPLIKCNPGQMNQVFLNILINAAQAIDKHGEIFVKTWYDSGHVNISISDTGCGIPADKIGRIFEPFFTTKEVGKGTGLGLSIAYDIVKKHHGTIKVKSTVGEGSAFTIALPAGER